VIEMYLWPMDKWAIGYMDTCYGDEAV